MSHLCIKITDKIILNIMKLLNVERTEEELANKLKCYPAYIHAHMQFLVKKGYASVTPVNGTRVYLLSDTVWRKLEVLRYKATAAAECKAMGGKPGGLPLLKDDDIFPENESLRYRMLELMADGSEQTSTSVAAHTGRKVKVISDQFLQMHRRGLVNRIEHFVKGHKKINLTITAEGLLFLAENRTDE